MLKVLELFAGIGACSKALERLGIEHEIVDAVEIDKYAIKSFNAVHGTNFEPQDITKWDKDIECDLIMHGSPCQDFSVAGLGKGGDKGSGTRSSLMYETLRIVEKLKPKYVIWENVKNLLSKKHRHNFDAYLQAMGDLGYHSTYKVLNAKDYGVPQNRERVFTVSVRKDLEAEFMAFEFPEPIELKTKLKDILEPVVDEKFYLSDEQVASFKASTAKAQAKGNGFKFEPLGKERAVARTIATRAGSRQTDNFIQESSISPTTSTSDCNREPIVIDDYNQRVRADQDTMGTLTTNCGSSAPRNGFKIAEPQTALEQPVDRDYKKHGKVRETQYEVKNDGVSHALRTNGETLAVEPIKIKTANAKGYDMATDGDGIDLAYPDSKTRRGRVGHGVAKTIPTTDSQGTLDGYRIRKLTPRECWRLMGFDDADFNKAEKVCSRTQLYKQAGNSIVVNVLMGILNNLLGSKHED